MLFLSFFTFLTFAILPFFNNLGSTERRADLAGDLFIKQNNIQVSRLACAGDFNGDGFGTCNIMTLDKEDIYLKCPTDFVDVKIFGAKKCREIFTNFDVGFHTIK